MGTGSQQTRRYIVQQPGGLNLRDREVELNNLGWSALKNAEFRRNGTIQSRRGYTNYRTAGTNPTPRNTHRFRTVGGNSGTVVYDDVNNDLHADYPGQDTGNFVAIDGVAAGRSALAPVDGFVRFAKWRDCTIYGSDGDIMRSFNPDAAAPFKVLDASLSGNSGFAVNQQFELPPVGLDILPVASDNWRLEDRAYVYRFTASVFHGDIFLGETHPLWKLGNINLFSGTATVRPGAVGPTEWDPVVREYWQLTYDFTTSLSGNQNRARMVKATTYLPTAWTGGGTFLYARYINVYRNAVPFRADEKVGLNYIEPTDKYFDMWRIGSISVADFDAATPYVGPPGPGEVQDEVFLDDGTVPISAPQLSYTNYVGMVKPRFMTEHKDRIWIAWVQRGDIVGSNWGSGGPDSFPADKLDPHALYWSERGAPFDFRSLSFLRVKPSVGDGITGLFSHRGRALLVFKSNTTMILLGGDDDLSPGQPNLYLDVLDPASGCIAPGSITKIENGCAWMSHQGPMIFQEGTRPTPLSADMVQNIWDSVPADRKYFTAGRYDPAEREVTFHLTFDGGDVGDDTNNRYTLRYSFRSNTWTSDYYPTLDVTSAVTIDDTDRERQTLMDLQIADNADDDAGTDIEFEATTGAMDCGIPYEDKDFQALLFSYRSPVALTVQVWCLRGETAEYDSSADTEFVATLPASTSATQDDYYHLPLTEGAWGKTIKIKVSGTTGAQQIELHKTIVEFMERGTWK